MQVTWKNMGRVATIATIATSAISALTYFVFLEIRVRNLEAQTQAILTMPPPGNNDHTSVGQGIEGACGDLAIRAAELRAEGSGVYSLGVERIMDRLGCMDIISK